MEEWSLDLSTWCTASIGLSATGTAIAVAGGAPTATAKSAAFSWIDLISKRGNEG